MPHANEGSTHDKRQIVWSLFLCAQYFKFVGLVTESRARTLS